MNAKCGPSGTTALHLAAREGRSRMVRLLLSGRAHVNALDNYQRSLLMLATHSGTADCVGLLRRHGADINKNDGNMATALRLAAFSGDVAVCNLLLA